MFNRKLYISLVLLLAVIAVLPSCKHTEEDLDSAPLNIIECQPTIDSMRQWYFFRPGSWWVYQEEETGTLDTISAYYYNDAPSGGGFSQIVTRAKSLLDGYTYEYYFNDSWTRPRRIHSTCDLLQIGLSKYMPGSPEGEGYLFFYPNDFTEYNVVSGYGPTGWHTGKGYIDHYYRNYAISGVDINCVAYRFIIEYDVVNHYGYSEYTWARGVGLVRKKNILADGSDVVWNLINYNVVF